MLCHKTVRGGQCSCFHHFTAQQNHSEALADPDGRSDTHSPLVAVTTVVFTPTTSVCGEPSAGRWSSGGTFTSFYLQDICPQANSIRKAGPVVAAGEIVEISSYVSSYNILYILLARGPTSPLLGSPFLKKGGCVLEDPPDLQTGEVFLYLLEV